MNNLRSFKHKGFVTLLLTALMAVGLSSCVNDQPPMVQVSKSIIRTGCDAQNITMTVMSNTDWTATSDAAWCTISPASGIGTKEVQIMVEACAATQERSAVITIKTDGSNSVSQTVKVTQGAFNSILLASPSQMTVGSGATSVIIAVSSNTDWTVASVSSWAKVDKTSGTGNGIVTVTVDENTSHSEDRTANVVITAGEGNERIMEDISITQLSRSMAVLNVTTSGVSFEAEGGTAVVPVITNIDGTVTATSEFAWCDASYAGGVVTITAAANTDNSSRVSVVNVFGSVEGATVCKQIVVYQAGLGDPKITLLTDNVSLASFSGDKAAPEQSVAVGYVPSTEGIDVTVAAGYPEWITDVKVDGTDNLVTFKVAANESTVSRSAVLGIVAKLANETMVYPVTVNQSGVGAFAVTVSSDALSIGAAGGELVDNVFVNAAQATVSAFVAQGDWVTVECTPMANSFGVNASLKITVAENKDADPRTATILVPAKVGDQVVYGTISLVQSGIGAPSVTILSNSLAIPHEGVTKDDNCFIGIEGVTEGTALSAVVPANWLKVSFSEDLDKILFVADAATSSASRSTVVTVYAVRGGETQIMTVNVCQAGTGSAELLIAQTSYIFEQVGGNYVMPIEAVNGTDYEVVDCPDWIVIEASTAPKGIKAVVTANPDTKRREGDIIILATNSEDFTYYVISTVQKGLEAPAVTLGQTELVIPGTKTVGTEGYAVTVIGADASTTLAVTTDQPWLKATANDAKTAINVAAEANVASEKRSATVTVVATRGGEDQVVSFKVVQPGKGSAELSIAVSAYTFGPKAVTGFEIPVTAKTTTTYTVAAKPEWITITGDGTAVMKIDVASNESTVEQRSGVIILRAVNGSDEIQYSISVTQLGMNGPDVTLAASSITVPNAAIKGTEGYSIAIIGADAATTLATSSTATWVKGVVDANNKVLDFVTEENAASEKRTAVVSVIATRAGVQQVLSVQVTQPGKGNAELKLALTSYSFSHKEVKDFVIPVTMVGSTSYKVAACPDWIVLEGVGTTAMKLSIAENKITELRTGSIILVANNGDDETQYTISVTQLGIDGPAVSLAYDTVVLPAGVVNEADGYFIPMIGVDADTKVLFTYHFEWIGPKFSTNYDRIVLTAKANPSAQKREQAMSIIATKGGQSQFLNFCIIQLGTGDAALEFSSLAYQFGHSKVDLFNIPIHKIDGTSWTYYSYPSWITVAGEGTEKAQISLDANDATGDPRTGDIVIKATNGDDVTFYTIAITQFGIDGPDVTVLDSELTLPAKKVKYTDGFVFNVDGSDDPTVLTLDIQQDGSWLEARVTTAEDMIQVRADKNENIKDRVALITVTAKKGGQTQYIYNLKVTQLGTGSPSIVMPSYEYSIAWNTKKLVIPYISVNGARLEWGVRNDPDDMIDYIDVKDKKVRIDFYKNATTEAKDAVITFDVWDKSGNSVVYQFKVTIHQASAEGPIATPTLDMVTLPNVVDATANILVTDYDTKPKTDITVTQDATITWFKATYTDGLITVKANSVNPDEDERSATFSFVAGRSGEMATHTITVTQPGNGGIQFTTDKQIYTVAQLGETIEAYYTSNKLTTATVVAAPDWITAPAVDAKFEYTAGSGNFHITVLQNLTADERTGEILFSLTNGDSQSFYKIAIVQPGTEGPDMTLLDEFVQLPYTAVTGNEYTINLQGYDAETSVAVTSSNDWLTIKSKSDASTDGTYQIVLNALANNHAAARTAQVGIVVTKNGQHQYFTVDVMQLGTGSPKLLMDMDNIYLNYEAQDPQINIYPSQNTVVSVYKEPSSTWLSNVAVNDSYIAFHAAENLDEYPRNDYFVLAVKRGDEVIYQTVRVYQSAKTAPYLEIPKGLLSFGANNGTAGNPPAVQTMTIPAANMKNVKYVRVQSISGEWLTITPMVTDDRADNADLTFTFTAVENIKADGRVARVVIEYGNDLDVEQTEFNVFQNGVGDPVAEFGSLEYFFDWNKHDNVKATLSAALGIIGATVDPEGASWITLGTVDNTGVIFNVAYNGTEYPRSSFITVSMANGGKTIYKTIRITQGAKTAPYMEFATPVEFAATATTDYKLWVLTSNVKRIKLQSNSGTGWLTVAAPTDQDLADGSHSIDLNLTANPSSQKRSALVVFEYGNDIAVQQAVLRVNQDGLGSPKFNLYNDTFHLDYSAQTVTAPFDGETGTTYAYVSKIGDFITANPTIAVAGGISFEVSMNDTEYPRFGYIVFSGKRGDETVYRTVQVYQGAKTAPYMKLGTIALFTTAAAINNEIDANFINVNRARIQSVTGSWLTATVDNEAITADGDITGYINLTAQANTSADERKAVITIEYGNELDVEQTSFTVIQAGVGAPSITVAGTVYGYPSAAHADYTIDVESIPAGAWVLDAAFPYPAWMANVEKNATNDLEFDLLENATEYTRDGYVVLKSEQGGKTARVSIHIIQYGQTAPFITLGTNKVSLTTAAVADAAKVTYSGTTQNVNKVKILSNTGSWLHLAGIANAAETDITADGANDLFTYYYDENTAAAARTAVVTLEYGNEVESHQAQVIFEQAGVGSPKLVISGSEFFYSSAVLTDQLIPVTATGTWSVATTVFPGWLTLAKDGNDIKFSLTENTTEYPRFAYVDIQAVQGGETTTKTIRIVQYGQSAPYMEIAPGAYYVDAASTTAQTIQATSKNVTTAKIQSNTGSAWLTAAIDGAFAFNSATLADFLTLTPTANTNADARTAKVVIEYGNAVESHTLAVYFTQAGTGDPLIIAGGYFSYTAAAVADAVIPVTSDPADAWTVESSYPVGSWLTVTKDATADPDVLTVSLTENTTGYARSGYVVLAVTKGGKTARHTIRIDQFPTATASAPYLTLGTTLINVDQTGVAVATAVSGNTENVTKVKVLGKSADWLTLTGTPLNVTADGDHDLFSYTATANINAAKRYGVVTIEYGNADHVQKAEILFVQNGVGSPKLSVSGSEFVYEAAASADNKIAVTSDPADAWTVATPAASLPAWLTNVENNAGNLEFDLAANTTEYARFAYVDIQVVKGGETAKLTVKVVQLAKTAPYMSINKNLFGFNNEAHTQEFTLTYENVKTLKVQSNTSTWVTVDISAFNAAAGTCVCSFSIPAFVGTKDRTAVITLQYGNDLLNRTLSFTIGQSFTAAVHTFDSSAAGAYTDGTW